MLVSLSEGNRTFQEVLSFEAGELTILADFDFEAGGNQGFSVAVPNNAFSGNWERVGPNGMTSQPEEDASEPGEFCWVTGQGQVGGSALQEDIDGGSTTLRFPIFDVTNLLEPRVQVTRWYHNTGNSFVDDVFRVDLSSDGGATWINAQTRGAGGLSGGWVSTSLNIEDTVPKTDQLRVRFLASDIALGSVVEAAIDDFRIVGFGATCPPPTSCCGTTPNSAGPGAMISTTGSRVVSYNEFGLEVTGSVPGQYGIFYYGAMQMSVAIGNGINCVGGNLFRLDPVVASSLGDVSYGADFANPPAPAAKITAGATWNSSWRYRDLGFGAGFDFSDGVSVTFCD